EVGHFQGAILPDVDTFRESLPYIEDEFLKGNEDKNLVMYCTGGIRCEKASAYFKHQGFKNVYQLEGGIIEYTRQIKEEGIKSKFIGKNFVFDHRLGERITDDIIAQCHQCGKPCDNHTNCANDACHLLFIQCDDCKAAMENCCSTECLETIHLPWDEQVKLRKGLQVGNKVFRKGKSDALKFKNSGDLTDKPLAKAETKNIRQKIAVKKELIGKAEHYYSKSKIAQFLIEHKDLSVGDKVLISGPTTGEQEVTITEIYANGGPCETANIGDQITFALPFRVRLSDKLYRIVQNA
uniref:rhodanese-like domain-containing protein n=1 Tax=Chryseobacterium cucumeris TaxID=1813611 RepID=UPI0023F46F79